MENALLRDPISAMQHEKGARGEDWMTEMFRLRGFHFSAFKSRKFQHDLGESNAGIELKFDDNMKHTGNLFVMHHAKYTQGQSHFHKTALLHDNNTWLYCYFDQNECFLIPKETLVRLYNEREALGLKERAVKRGTSLGYLLPKSRFRELHVECGHWIFTEEEKAIVNSRVGEI